MKRIIILLVSLLLGIALLAYYYFSRLRIDNQAEEQVLQTATNQAAMVFSFKNDKAFYDLLGSQNLLQKLIGESKTNLFISLRQHFVGNKSMAKLFNHQEIYVSILPDEQQQLNFLITTQINPEGPLKKLFQQFLAGKQIKPLSNHLFTLNLNDTSTCYIYVNQQVITLSASKNLVLAANQNLKESDFTHFIKESNKFNKNVLMHAYINFNLMPLLMKNIIQGQMNGEISFLKKQDSYASLSYNYSKDRILFNGNTVLNSNDNYLKTFEDCKPENINIQDILPENTANYTIYNFNQYASWHKKLIEWQKQTREFARAVKLAKNLKNKYRLDLEVILNNYAKNEFTTFQLNTSEKLAAIALTNGDKVNQLLLDISTDYSENIKVFKEDDLLWCYFGAPFKKFIKPYYTIIDNHLVIANYASTLQSFLSHYQNNKLLTGNFNYINTINQISSTANICYYINRNNSIKLLGSELKPSFYEHLNAENGLKNFNTFYYQLISDNKKFITNLLLSKNTQDTLIKKPNL